MSEIRVKSTGTIKLFESDNTSSVTIASPASLSANRTITIPDADVNLTNIATNTAKTTNATHSGEVTGATALTIADNIVDEANLKISNAPVNGYSLTAQSGNTGGLTWANIGGGVVLLSTQTVTGASEVSAITFDTVFNDNSYTNYLFQGYTSASTQTSLRATYRSGGSDASQSQYYWTSDETIVNSSGTVTDADYGSGGSDHFRLNGANSFGADANNPISFNLWCIDPKRIGSGSHRNYGFSQTSMFDGASDIHTGTQGSHGYRGSDTPDGIIFHPTSGALKLAEIRLYGVMNA